VETFSTTERESLILDNPSTLPPVQAIIVLLTGIHMPCVSADAQVFVTSYKFKNSTHTHTAAAEATGLNSSDSCGLCRNTQDENTPYESL